jgi:hypothetical protein
MAAAVRKARRNLVHDHGVGTSSATPLALVGGAFGWGLERDVRDLDIFACRHHRPGSG